MRVYLLAMTALLSLSFVVSCNTKQIREVASAEPNADRIRYLRNAAENGVLFLIGDSVLHDVPYQQVGTCRKSADPIWSARLLSVLEALDQNPRLYNKMHIIEVKRGDSPKIEMDRGGDGLTRMVVKYSKRKSFEKITPMTDVDCARSDIRYLNKDLEVSSFDWPNTDQIVKELTAAPEKPAVERFNFNKKFLIYLADRLSIFKVTQKQIFDQNPSGEYAIYSILNRLDAEISDSPKLTQIDFWLKEISVQSKQANNLVFFGLNDDRALSYGVKVDSAGKLNRRINHQSDPSYPFISFKETNGKYESVSLKDLNTCLGELSTAYKARYSGNREVANSFELDTDSFLYPGYSCAKK